MQLYIGSKNPRDNAKRKSHFVLGHTPSNDRSSTSLVRTAESYGSLRTDPKRCVLNDEHDNPCSVAKDAGFISVVQ